MTAPTPAVDLAFPQEALIKYLGTSVHLCVLRGLRFLSTVNQSFPEHSEPEKAESEKVELGSGKREGHEFHSCHTGPHIMGALAPEADLSSTVQLAAPHIAFCAMCGIPPQRGAKRRAMTESRPSAASVTPTCPLQLGRSCYCANRVNSFVPAPARLASQKPPSFSSPTAAPKTPTRRPNSSATSPEAARSRRKSSKKSDTAIR